MIDLIKTFIDVILHVDVHLKEIIQAYDTWTYGILFLIIFLETGLVITPFLPGDSLLFVVGAFAASNTLNLWWVLVIITAAAIMGDTVNYHIGKYLGPKVFKKENSWIFHREHLERTHAFYEKYGGKTIILARFIPVIRTFAPFVAGIGKMAYGRFISYNIIGGILWTFLFILGGYFFGNISWVKENFSLVIIGIIVLSFIPVVKEVMVHFFQSKKETKNKTIDNENI